jgi:hypothetical protein
MSNTNPIELFEFLPKSKHYFEALNATFWDSDNTITKKYKSLKNTLEDENEDDKKNFDKANKTLLNFKLKSDYLRYLMFEYTLSQPNNLDELTDDYYSVIFPYYLFLLRNEGYDELNYLVLDNINFAINIYEKNYLKNSFEIDAITDINLTFNSIEIQIVNIKDNIEIIPYINQHIELIYILIFNMVTIKNKKENWKKELSKVNEINQNLEKNTIKTIDTKKFHLFNLIDINKLKILTNDSFVPKGIIASSYVSLEYNKNSQDRYLLLGRRYLYLFKNDTLKEFTTIIPLSTGFTIIELEEAYQKIRIKTGLKDIIFYIYKKEEFISFRDKLMDILEGNKEDIFDKDDLFKCSKAFYDDKVMGGVFENTPIYEKNQKDMKKLDEKINELNKIKDEIEKECITNENIRQRIGESD